MKALAVALFLFLAPGLVAQDSVPTQRNHAACSDYRVWTAQEQVRHNNPDGWFEHMGPLLADRLCWLTAEGGRVFILERDKEGHALRVTRGGEDGEWWLSAEAILP